MKSNQCMKITSKSDSGHIKKEDVFKDLRMTVIRLSVLSVSGDVTLYCRTECDKLELLTPSKTRPQCVFDGAPLCHMMESVGVK